MSKQGKKSCGRCQELQRLIGTLEPKLSFNLVSFREAVTGAIRMGQRAWLVGIPEEGNGWWCANQNNRAFSNLDRHYTIEDSHS